METVGLPAITGYRLVCLIGEGGMSRVYLAEREDEPGRFVALKLIHERNCVRPKVVRRFQREGRVGRALSHPNILPVLACEERGGQWLIAMEHVDGLPFTERIRAMEALEGDAREAALRENLEILLQVAGALAYAHRNGVLHRDVKPANILVRGDGHAFLIDFGLAREVAGETMLTSTGVSVGTPAYMSPEQVDGHLHLGPQTDVWSFGVLLFEAVTGERPFDAESWPALAERIRTDEPPRLAEKLPTPPPGLEAVVLRALEKDPGRRYPDMAALQADLERVSLGLLPHTGLWPLLARRGLRRAGRQRLRIAAAALVATAALALLLGAFWSRTRGELAETERVAFRGQLMLDVQRGDYDHAFEAIDALLERDPDGPFGHLMKAWTLSQLAPLDPQIEAAIERGLEADGSGDDATDRYARGLRHIARREFALAEGELSSALALDEGLADAWFPMYVARAAQGRMEEAVRALEQYRRNVLLESNPRHRLIQAQILELQGRFEDAVLIVEELAGILSREEAREIGLGRHHGRFLFYVRRFDEAQQVLTEVLAEDPRDGFSWAILSLVHMRKGRWPEARGAALRALELQPFLSGPVEVLANWAMFQDDVAAAVDAVVEELELLLPPERRAREFDLLLAEQDFRAGRFEECLARNPDHLGARLGVGQELWWKAVEASEAKDPGLERRLLERARPHLEHARDLLREHRARYPDVPVWTVPYCTDENLLTAEYCLLEIACRSDDEELARSSLAAVERILAGGFLPSQGLCLNIAEVRALCGIAAVRDPALARELVDRWELAQHFDGEPDAERILDRIEAAR